MYLIADKKYKNNNKIFDYTDLLNIDGFMMTSRKKTFRIKDADIKKIKIVDRELAHPLVSIKVRAKYKRLIEKLTELLLEEDDDGETVREALNQIEKFRLEIKNKYRRYLDKIELEKMAKNLKIIKKELETKKIIIENSYLEYMESNKRSK